MSSKMVTDRQKSSLIVEKTATLLGPKAAELLVPLLTAGLGPGEQPPDLGLGALLLGKALERARLRMVEADSTRGASQRRDRALRDLRDRSTEELRERLREVRNLLDAAYGPGAASTQAAIDPTVHRDPVVLLRMADEVVRELQAPTNLTATQSAPLLPGVTLDRAAWIERIAAPRQALIEAIDAIAGESRSLVHTFGLKTRAIAAYDATFGQVARLLEAMFAAAGMPEEAARVRPSSRRPGQTDAEVEGPGEEPSEPPGAAVPAAPIPTSDPPAVS